MKWIDDILVATLSAFMGIECLKVVDVNNKYNSNTSFDFVLYICASLFFVCSMWLLILAHKKFKMKRFL